MSDDHFTDVLKSAVYLRLKKLADWQSETPAGEPNNTHDPGLSRRLLGLLSDCGETVDSFAEKADIPPHLMNSVLGGAFIIPVTEQIVAGLQALAPEINKRLKRNVSEWVSIRTGRPKAIAEKTRKAAESLFAAVRESNAAGTGASVISEAQRIQLIALLESLIAELKGNYADRGRQKTLNSWFGKILSKAAAGGIEDAVTAGMKMLVDAIKEFLSATKDDPPSNLPDDE